MPGHCYFALTVKIANIWHNNTLTQVKILKLHWCTTEEKNNVEFNF